MTTLHYKDYEGSIEASTEGRCLHGKILFVTDLVTYEGKSFDELETAFQEAVDDYLAFCEQVGKPPEKPYKGVFNVRVRPEAHRALVIRAFHDQQTLNELVCAALDAYLLKTEIHHTHHHVHEHVVNEQPRRTQWSNEGSASFFETILDATPDFLAEADDYTFQSEGMPHWNLLKTANSGRC